MRKKTIKETLNLQELSAEEKASRGILGRLYGPCADIINPTRNGRKYPDELWDNVFKNDVVREMFANGGIPMELDHPTDRDETCSEKIAAIMPEPPKKDDDGHLVCYVDILDTPMGKIAYQLAKYGFKLGISSRGTGDVVEDVNGEYVDPDTYEFTTFDLVLLPAVKDARLSMVESLDTSKDGFKKAMRESLDSSSAGDRALMEDTLKNLHIDIGLDAAEEKAEEPASAELSGEKEEECVTETCADKPEAECVDSTDDVGGAMFKKLQDEVSKNSELEAEISDIRDQLAVSDAKATELETELARYKKLVSALGGAITESREAKKEAVELQDKLADKDSVITKLESEKTELAERLNSSEETSKSLQEKLTALDIELKKSNDALIKLKESYESKEDEHAVRMKESASTTARYKKLAEQYKKLAHETADRYIASKASMLGITSNEVKNRLNESYDLDDVDKVCEQLQESSLNIGRLPFQLSSGARVRVTESRHEAIRDYAKGDVDDEVDDSLLRMAGLK